MVIKYKALAKQLEAVIIRNIQLGIPKLPTEQELCSRYLVSRQTVRAALALLEQQGLIERKHGSGSYITGQLPDSGQNIVAVLVSSPQDYIYPDVLADIHDVLAAAGFSDQVYSTGNSVSAERDILTDLLKNPPRGIIVEGCKSALPNPNLGLYHALQQQGCALVFLYNHYPALLNAVFVQDDNYCGSAMLVRDLAAQGHTCIGGIFKADDLQGVERYQGFIETMLELELPVSDNRICWYGSHELERLLTHGDTAFLHSMMAEALAGCTAIVCYNDIIAYHLAGELSRAGYRMPEDMTIAAFDNTYLSTANSLPVLTLSHEPHQMGVCAANAMLCQLKGLAFSSLEISWKRNQRRTSVR